MIDRALKYAFAVTMLVLFSIWLIFGNMDALAGSAGIAWGAINLYLIAGIIEALLVSKRYLSAILMMVLKFPLLYGIGYMLLTVNTWNIWVLLAGPPFAFLLVAVNALWRFSMRSA